MSALSDRLDPKMAQTLRVIALAMGAGVALLAAVVALLHARSDLAVATPQSLRATNALTVITMAVAVSSIGVSELLWKLLLRKMDETNINQKVQRAFLVRTALRESSALFGAVAALIASQTGVLRAQPAYWANLAPATLFWSYLYLHWPSLENLKTELDAVSLEN